MAVRKRCQEDGCKRGDHRCDHPWWFDVMHNGKRHRMRVNDFVLPRLAEGSDLRSINTRTCAEAWEPRFLGEVQAGRDPRVPPNAPTDAMTVLQLIADYRSRYVEVEPLRSRHSIHSSLNVIARFFGSLPVRVLQSPASIEDFKKQYAPRHKAASLNRHLARLRHLIGWAIGREVLSITPFRRNGVKLNTRDEEQRSRRVYPDEEARLLGACAKLDVGDYRFTGSEMKDRFIGALETGCRRGEMLKIRNLDVDWTKHRIALPARNTKSAKGRVIPFDPQGRLAEVLRRRRFLGPDAFVFGA
jgi:integrase